MFVKSKRGGETVKRKAKKQPIEAPDSLYDYNTEEALLGALMLGCEDEEVQEIRKTVGEEDFARTRHRWIYRACMEAYSKHGRIDPVLVGNELKGMEEEGKNLFEASGGAGYLSALVDETPTTAGAVEYARVVHELAVKRRIFEVGLEITKVAQEKKSLGEIIAKVSDLVGEITVADELPKRILRWRRFVKVTTNPPHYRLEISTPTGWALVSFDSWQELKSWSKFQDKVAQELDFLPIKPRDWDTELNRMLSTLEVEEAPRDASFEERVKYYITEWLGNALETTEVIKADLSRHPCVKTVKGEEVYVFKKETLIGHLRQRGVAISDDKLWEVVRAMGGGYATVRFGRETEHCWVIPVRLFEGEGETDGDEGEQIDSEWDI